MAELRKCKECGKMFLPKGREQYCPDVHYRPCPICGEPVIAKYLSDPPRKCSNCRGKKSASAPSKTTKLFQFADKQFADNQFSFKPKPKAEQVDKPEEAPKPSVTPKGLFKTDDLILEIPETIDRQDFCTEITETIRRYVGPVVKNGFVPGHDYQLQVTDESNTYGVKSELDVTDHSEVNIFMHFTSQISINQNFARIKEKK